ncbi:MAG: acyl-CoA dehydrogenase [Negativicutes bacterium]|jgi:alkylation response protein AidB-like acyl-CoA dehydrogenase|nr:acyl-CoA dehydrogenase [Negativicutes bacterium]
MNFKLTEEQLQIQKMVKDFSVQELEPSVHDRDQASKFDRNLYNKMADQGFTGIYFEEKYGGAEMDYTSYILAIEEMSKVDDGMAISLSATVSLCAAPIHEYGTEEQKAKYLTPLAEGSKMGAFGLTEPNAGTDAGGQQTVAVLEGDHYVLNGSKIFITNGSEAEINIIFAMTDKSRGARGITAFIVEKGTPGFSIGAKEDKLGIRTSITTELIFQDCKIPVENRLGKEGEGFKIAMKTLDGGRIGVAAQALGIATAALDHAIRYSKERQQFGKPISAFQAISFMMADMAMKIDAARLLVYRAAWLKETGQEYGTEAAMAKCFASDVAMEVTTDAIQIFGGYGYSKEYPVERLMRNAKITQIYEGTNQVQRMVISGAILR